MRKTSTTYRREAEGSSPTHPTPRDQESSILLEISHHTMTPCCICFTIPHKYFTDKQVENVRNNS